MNFLHQDQLFLLEITNYIMLLLLPMPSWWYFCAPMQLLLSVPHLEVWTVEMSSKLDGLGLLERARLNIASRYGHGWVEHHIHEKAVSDRSYMMKSDLLNVSVCTDNMTVVIQVSSHESCKSSLRRGGKAINCRYTVLRGSSLEKKYTEAHLSMNPLNFGTLGLPKSRKRYGNGVLVVPARWGSNTARVMPGEGKGGQSTHSRETTPPESLHDRVSTYNRVPRKRSQGIYQQMIQTDSLKAAYEAVSCKSSANTKATTDETLDATSEATLTALHRKLKDHSFKFKPVRRVHIPKKDGSKRPLGIPSPRDKIVQKAMCNVLEEIYEKEELFLDCSHGFRPGRSTHTALKQATLWTGVKWFIEGDISNYFDTIDHEILVKLLEYEIDDREFTDIIRKGLKCKYIDLVNATSEIGKIGTPQGGTVSPVLSNIYLHELDLWITESFVKPSRKSGKISIPNPEYKKLHDRISNLSQVFKSSYRYNTKLTEEELADRKLEIRKLEKERALIKSTIPGDGYRIYYVRYADDFLIGVNGSYDLACKIRGKIGAFLKKELSLKLNMEKTVITSTKKGRALFLGAELRMHFSRTNDQKVVRMKKRSLSNRLLKKRVPNSNIIALAPLQKLVEELEEQGICKIRNFSKREIIPKRKTAWLNLPIEDIISKYNSVWQGTLSYYSFAYNRSQLNLIQYLLEHSLACTLMNKMKLNSRAQVFKKFGRPIKYRFKTENKKGEPKTHTIQFKVENTLARINKFNKTKQRLPNAPFLWSLRSKYRWSSFCSICQSGDDVEMHHRRPLKASATDNTLRGITRNMTRKQIPLCRACHVKVHQGKYDGPGIY